jgi:hypothetical protein
MNEFIKYFNSKPLSTEEITSVHNAINQNPLKFADKNFTFHRKFLGIFERHLKLLLVAKVMLPDWKNTFIKIIAEQIPDRKNDIEKLFLSDKSTTIISPEIEEKLREIIKNEPDNSKKFIILQRANEIQFIAIHNLKNEKANGDSEKKYFSIQLKDKKYYLFMKECFNFMVKGKVFVDWTKMKEIMIKIKLLDCGINERLTEDDEKKAEDFIENLKTLIARRAFRCLHSNSDYSQLASLLTETIELKQKYIKLNIPIKYVQRI